MTKSTPKSPPEAFSAGGASGDARGGVWECHFLFFEIFLKFLKFLKYTKGVRKFISRISKKIKNFKKFKNDGPQRHPQESPRGIPSWGNLWGGSGRSLGLSFLKFLKYF